MTNDEFFYLLSEEVKTYKSYLEKQIVKIGL